jgi:hypothetical protein
MSSRIAGQDHGGRCADGLSHDQGIAWTTANALGYHDGRNDQGGSVTRSLCNSRPYVEPPTLPSDHRTTVEDQASRHAAPAASNIASASARNSAEIGPRVASSSSTNSRRRALLLFLVHPLA